MDINTEKYSKEYSETKLTTKITRFGKKMGAKLVYCVLLLYYTLKNPNVPAKIRATIIAALGYVISPIDLIFDGLPAVGYGDDISAIMAAFAVIGFYVTPEIKQHAKDKMRGIFGESIITELEVIDIELNNKRW